MRLAGLVLMGVGALAALFAFNMDTTIYSSGTFIGGQYVGGGSTHNLGLLQQQMMILQTGLAAFVAGAILYGSATADGGGTAGRDEPSNSRWADIQEHETEGERDERLARARRQDMFLLGAIIALIALLALLTNWPLDGSGDSTGLDNLPMTADENLMILDENLTTDVNSL